jgi:hypothetical protein
MHTITRPTTVVAGYVSASIASCLQLHYRNIKHGEDKVTIRFELPIELYLGRGLFKAFMCLQIIDLITLK